METLRELSRLALAAPLGGTRTHPVNLEQTQQDLKEKQEEYFALGAYTRSLFHWLQEFCEIMEPDFLARHPKPRLPDRLRPDIAPETVGKGD